MIAVAITLSLVMSLLAEWRARYWRDMSDSWRNLYLDMRDHHDKSYAELQKITWELVKPESGEMQ